jgi:hypothetical protein
MGLVSRSGRKRPVGKGSKRRRFPETRPSQCNAGTAGIAGNGLGRRVPVRLHYTGRPGPMLQGKMGFFVGWPGLAARCAGPVKCSGRQDNRSPQGRGPSSVRHDRVPRRAKTQVPCEAHRAPAPAETYSLHLGCVRAVDCDGRVDARGQAGAFCPCHGASEGEVETDQAPPGRSAMPDHGWDGEKGDDHEH